jgi:hypothetical protein
VVEAFLEAACVGGVNGVLRLFYLHFFSNLDMGFLLNF